MTDFKPNYIKLTMQAANSLLRFLRQNSKIDSN